RQLFADSSDHEWRVRLSDRLRLAARFGHLIVAALYRCFFFGPHALDDRNSFVETANPFACGVKRNAIRVVLLLKPGGADSHDQTSGDDVIDLGTHLRKDGGMSIRVSVTSPPASTFFVSAATAVSAVQPSKHGPDGSARIG